MNQFFISVNQISDGYVTITGEDFNHIANVLRMHRGEKIRAAVPDGKAYLCEIDAVTSCEVRARILDLDGTYAELPGEIILYQGLPKGDKMELIIQKAVELGVRQIVPTAMTNCVVKLSGEKAGKKVKRWQAIAGAAAQQSKRSMIPQVGEITALKKAAADARTCDVVFIPYEMADADTMLDTKSAIEKVRPGMKAGVFIGPEGGFDPKEIDLLREVLGEKAKIISLGHRILRTETAGLTMLSILMYYFEVAAAEEENRSE